MDILAYAMRLIVSQVPLETFFFQIIYHQAQYRIRRSNNKIVNVPPLSEQQIISQLDSAMNDWMDTIPCHRRSNLLYITISF